MVENIRWEGSWLDKNTENAGIFATVAGEIARLVTLELKSKVDGSARAVYLNPIYQSVIWKTPDPE
ncbi:MAG: hypothetical protein V8S98_13440 [Lachnospiraceae bacterium]